MAKREKLGEWKNEPLKEPRLFGGERLDSELVHSGGAVLARVTYGPMATSYTVWVGSKRDGGYSGPYAAQKAAERAVRKAQKWTES